MSVIERERVEEVAAPKKVTVADVLERAAYGYEEDLYGWHPGPGYESDGNLCMVGAIQKAASDLRFLWPEDEAEPWDSHFVCWKYGDGGSQWNDMPGRTKAEVVAALHAMSEKARQ